MEQNIYIFGAHSRARTLGVYLTKIYPNIRIKAYLYDNDEPNADSIEGIPVICLTEDMTLEVDCPVYLGTKGVYHSALTEKLQRIGVKEIIPVTPQLDLDLRNRFLPIYYAEMGRSYDKLDSISESVCIYVVRSVFDKPLQHVPSLAVFRKEIQAGASLTEDRICGLTDDTGENISERNPQFCELTVLYWIWKNAKQDIVGLEHYRRHFLLQDDWYQKMRDNHIDVILPTPLYVAPSLAQNYKERHVASDWEFMMDYLKRINPEDYKEAVSFFDTNLYSPCNMFIMKKEVLSVLCTWLFPILFVCAEHGGKRQEAYQNRYPGFLAERLMTFFFEKCREKYKIVYADKIFLN
ncbi:MAG: DUF4422 domain-containing protein [Lachnospiraceae bacterium]|nr:DUF4422 domain-containing protein [Lachnospiraceae bacterium]